MGKSFGQIDLYPSTQSNTARNLENQAVWVVYCVCHWVGSGCCNVQIAFVSGPSGRSQGLASRAGLPLPLGSAISGVRALFRLPLPVSQVISIWGQSLQMCNWYCDGGVSKFYIPHFVSLFHLLINNVVFLGPLRHTQGLDVLSVPVLLVCFVSFFYRSKGPLRQSAVVF